MVVSSINNIPLNNNITPIGLIKRVPRPDETIENVELRSVLEKAVKDAHLNVTERLALNKQFFPYGGGFELFPEDTQVHQFNYYLKKGSPDFDEFTHEASAIKLPEHVCRVKEYSTLSSKNSYEKNLENAIKKLRQSLKGNI